VPLYNKAPYVRRCLESIRGQDYTDYEIIVVDDGSTDDGPAIARQYLREHDTLTVQENAGPGAARNRGIEAARGEYVAFLDADDEWVPEFLGNAVRIFAKWGQTLDVVSQARLVQPIGQYVTPPRRLVGRAFRLGPHCTSSDAEAVLGTLGTGRVTVRRSVLARLGGFYDREKATLGEDTWLWLKMTVGASIYALPGVGMVQHTDAGELCGAGRVPMTVTRIPPFLEECERLLLESPAPLRGVLKALIAQYALSAGIELLLQGQCGKAWELIAGRLSLLLRCPRLTVPALKMLAARCPGADWARRSLWRRRMLRGPGPA
jgi:hypothetical protein